MADREEEEHTIAEDVVVTKYKMVAEIVNSMAVYYISYFAMRIKLPLLINIIVVITPSDPFSARDNNN